MRDNYLNWISYYRNEQYKIYYQDETWVFKNMSCTKIWEEIVSSSTEDLYKVPAGKGARSIVCHLGCSETGLLSDCLLLLRRSKSNKSSDYHTEMNWNAFSSWCESKVFPEMMKTNQKSVMVVDRASYHTYLDEDDKRPISSWNKTKLADAIYRGME